MMATVEDIESSEIQDSKMLVNHGTNNDHGLVERHVITKGFQQNIASFITGNTRLRQGIEGPFMTPSMQLERDYTIVYFGRSKHKSISPHCRPHTTQVLGHRSSTGAQEVHDLPRHRDRVP